jgi:hypothetical protein
MEIEVGICRPAFELQPRVDSIVFRALSGAISRVHIFIVAYPSLARLYLYINVMVVL